jgi:hypothetical protein
MQKYHDAVMDLPPPDVTTSDHHDGEGDPAYSVEAVHRLVASLTAPKAPASYRAAFYDDAAKDFEGVPVYDSSR